MWFVTAVYLANYGCWIAVQYGCTGLHLQYDYYKYSHTNIIATLTQDATLHIFTSSPLTIIASVIIKLSMAGTFIPLYGRLITGHHGPPPKVNRDGLHVSSFSVSVW